MKRLNNSSAGALNVASTSTVDVFKIFALGGGLFAAGLGAGVAAVVVEVVIVDCTGVPVRLASALTVRSFPWVSMIAAGNSANLVSSAVASFAFASRKSASTGLEDFVESVQSYLRANQAVRDVISGAGERGSYRVFRKPIERNFVRDFWDDQLPIHLGSVKGFTRPLELDFDIIDRDQPAREDQRQKRKMSHELRHNESRGTSKDER